VGYLDDETVGAELATGAMDGKSVNETEVIGVGEKKKKKKKKKLRKASSWVCRPDPNHSNCSA
jgi:hypothetical protein